MKEIYSPDRIAEMIMTIDPDFYLPSDEQRPIISIDTNPLEPAVVIAGAGSGKTLLACQVALDLLFSKEIEKIVIARPVITSGEELGFLPGDIKEKMDPFMAPIYENMHRLYSKEKIEKYVSDGLIEIIPFTFMRGRNISNALVIIDEAHDIINQLKVHINYNYLWMISGTYEDLLKYVSEYYQCSFGEAEHYIDILRGDGVREILNEMGIESKESDKLIKKAKLSIK